MKEEKQINMEKEELYSLDSELYLLLKNGLSSKGNSFALINKDNFKNEIHAALLQLNTEKKVRDNLPEALKYIEFPPEKQLPSCQFDDLNKAISKI